MLKVFLVEDETVIREGLRDRIPWNSMGIGLLGRQQTVKLHCR